MTIESLESILVSKGVPPIYYSFSSDGFGEVYRIQYMKDILGDGWEVYYSERGNKNRLIIFRSESEACEYFLKWILGDTTLQKHLKA